MTSQQPFVSVVMPVYNGSQFLARAVDSVLRQTSPFWELLIVDDCSLDDSYARALAFARQDPRIRVLKTALNSGCGEARNVALPVARGTMLAYLDCDDEYYSDYFELIARFSNKADVLIFSYDYIDDTTTHSSCPTQIRTWSPLELRNELFTQNVSTPLGVSHSRNLLSSLGGFNSAIWGLEDWELWKRMARSGAEFVYLPFRSGLYHIRADSLTRSPKIQPAKLTLYLNQWVNNAPMYGGNQKSTTSLINYKILYISSRCILDEYNDTIILADVLKVLDFMGWSCVAFCSTWLPSGPTYDFSERLNELHLDPEPPSSQLLDPKHTSDVIFTSYKGVRTVVVSQDATVPIHYKLQKFLQLYSELLTNMAPHIVITDSCDWVSAILVRLAKQRDIIVMCLPNVPHPSWINLIRDIDYCLVTSQKAKRQWFEEYDVHCQWIPYPYIEKEAEFVAPSNGTHIAVISEYSASGKQRAIQIAKAVIAEQRDLKVLTYYLEGRDRFERTSYDCDTIQRDANSTWCADIDMRNPVILIIVTHDIRLVSVVIRAMQLGIPVLVRGHGVLSEVVEGNGRRAGAFRSTCAANDWENVDVETKVWVRTIVQLCGDPVSYRVLCEEALEIAQLWRLGNIKAAYNEVFTLARPQPGAPLLIKGARKRSGSD